MPAERRKSYAIYVTFLTGSMAAIRIPLSVLTARLLEEWAIRATLLLNQGRQATPQFSITMTIREQQRAGEWYAARGDSQMINELYQCEQACYEINQIPPSRRDERNERIRQLFGKAGSALNVNTPFHCDFGKNIEVGNYFFANFNLIILDENRVIFGHHVYIGPNCSFYTAIHPLDVERRNADIQKALPIHVGDNVWIGGNVTVLPGVRIGSGSTIGAGSVVTHDIPDGVLAAGNPARVIRKIEDGDK